MTDLEKQFLDCCTKYYSDRSIIGSDDLLKYIDVPLISLQRCAERLEQHGYIKISIFSIASVLISSLLTKEPSVAKCA